MRRLLLSLLFLFAFGVVSSVFGVDWGKITVYASWEITTDFGGGQSQTAYIALGNAKFVEPENGYPPRGTPHAADDNLLAVYVFSDKKNYRQVSNTVKLDPSNPAGFDTDWLLNFTTKSGTAANVTFTCLTNEFPAPENLTLQLLTVGNEAFPLPVLAGETTTVLVPSADDPNSVLANYSVPYVDGVKHRFTLEPGWNLTGIPFERVTDAGALFSYPVLAVGTAPTRVSAASELTSGRSYWVYNGTSEPVEVTLVGSVNTVREETAFPALSAGWNYVSPVGAYDTSTKSFRAATEKLSELQFHWDAAGQCFGEFEQEPSIAHGYMVRE